MLDGLLHLRDADERPWPLLVPVLALAFAARAAVALAGDFVLHPDEIMQYLEPAHRLAFGDGVIYWEWLYGARSWLVPGAVAAVMKLFDAAGLGAPWWYVDGVKLFFCALSLAIPAGMYLFAAATSGRRRRGLTFAERPREPRGRQWTRFVASSLVGLGVNVGSYFVLTTFVAPFARHRLPALVLGVGLGGVVNFLVANRYVYRRRPAEE